MRKLFAAAVFLFAVGVSFSHITPAEMAEAKRLVDSNASCASLSEDQLELIGEYIMELMHPGEAHELMHRMMGLVEGSPEEKAFHVLMARNMYCGQGTGMMGMMMGGYGYAMGPGMMGYYGAPNGTGGMMGGYGPGYMMGPGMMGWAYPQVQAGDGASLLGWAVWILLAVVLILLAIHLFKSITAGKRAEPLDVLKARLAMGAISRKEYAELKKEIEG